MPDSPSLPSDTHLEEPSSVIDRIHESASVQYRITKRRKQEDLAYKVAAAQRAGDKALLKSEKKKVDNHASAVASRVRQEFLVAAFEALVTAKMTDCARLRALVRKHVHDGRSKDDTIQHLTRQVARLTEDRELLQHQLHHSASDHSTTQAPAWLSGLELPMDSPGLPPPFGDVVASPILPPPADSVRGVGSPLSSFLEAVSPRTHDGTSKDSRKLDSHSWELHHATDVVQRQASVRARLKRDEHDDSFNPVA